MLKKEVKEAIDMAEFELTLNLENNYREDAYQDFLNYVTVVKKYRDAGMIKPKDMDKLAKKISDYKTFFVEREEYERENMKRY
jgi:hypothetical protein